MSGGEAVKTAFMEGYRRGAEVMVNFMRLHGVDSEVVTQLQAEAEKVGALSLRAFNRAYDPEHQPGDIPGDNA